MNQLEYSQINYQTVNSWSIQDKEKYFDELIISFAPFTYYNENIQNTLNDYISIFKQSDSPTISSNLSNQYFSLYKQLFTSQQQLNYGFFWTFIISVFISIVSFFSITEKDRLKKNELTILSAINENQLKLSRDLHDGIAQDLTALRISIKNEDIEKASYFADQAFNEIRFLLENNHIEINQDFDLNIKNILETFEHHFGIDTELYLASKNIKLLPIKHQFELIRILNESLSNVARHSQAKNVIIRITDTIKGFNFIISDDGIGKESFTNKDKTIKHFGIENIKNRVSEMNGNVNFDFEGGTTIAISLENFIS